LFDLRPANGGGFRTLVASCPCLTGPPWWAFLRRYFSGENESGFGSLVSRRHLRFSPGPRLGLAGEFHCLHTSIRPFCRAL